MSEQTRVARVPTIEIITHPEHTSIRGNAMASGDDAVDRECEDRIIDRLNNEHEWAWCVVEVRLTCCGLSASDYLGCWSSDDEQGFREGGYYAAMVGAAYEELSAQFSELQRVTLTRPEIDDA